MSSPELSVIVTSYKNPELLRLCLESLKKNDVGLSYEIIVCDSATEEATEILMREEFPEVKFFPFLENVGLARLLEKAIASSTGAYILYMNGDIVVTPGSVGKLLDYLKEHPDIGLVGPKLLNFNGTFQYSCFRFYKPITILYRRTFLKHLPFAKRHLDWFLMKEFDHQDSKEVDWIMGSVLLMSRKAVDRVGSMDTAFFMYMEDVDWCRRFWEAGYKVVYYPHSEMFHYHGKGSARGGFFRSLLFNRLTWYHIKSAIRYFWKYLGKPAPEHK
jgi:GT2 family glycosyltransferase